MLTWICHRCTWVPNPEPPFHLRPHTIPLGHPSAPAPSILYPAMNLDWRFISCMILYMFQCHSPKSSHPLPLPQSPKVCSIHLYLFCCLKPLFLTVQSNLLIRTDSWLVNKIVDSAGKEPTRYCRRHKRGRFDPWVGKIPWRRKRQPTPVFLPGTEYSCPLDRGAWGATV